MSGPETTSRSALNSDALVFGCVLDGVGGARSIEWEETQNWTSDGQGETLWLHLDRNVAGLPQWLESRFGISKATVVVLTSNETRPRAFCEDGALITILRGINFNPGAEPEDMIAMQIWADENCVITLRRRKLQTPRDVQGALGTGHGPRNAGDLVTSIVEQMVSKMNRSIVDMNDRIDVLEENEDERDNDELLDDIADIRRNCLALKRFMSPQHEALLQIGHEAPSWMSEENRRDIRETIDRLRRYLEDLDVSKESAILLQDDVNNRIANQSNRTMYMLSIVAAIFLPLGFVTGLLGINVGGMPGVESGDAFWVTVGLLTALFALQLLIFRKLKWL